MRSYLKYVLSAVAALLLLVAGGASAFVISHVSSKVAQRQPPAHSCRVRGKSPFYLPDLHCTPGALNAAVTQATVRKTICHSGYTSRIRPSTSVTGPRSSPACAPTVFASQRVATSTTTSFRWSLAAPRTTGATCGQSPALHRT
jgi:hypothetical protein